VTSTDDGAIVMATERLLIRPWRVDEADRFFDIHRRIEVVRWTITVRWRSAAGSG
jgi:hypothetical protein